MTLTNIQSTAQQMAETASTVSADRHTDYVPKPITGQQYSISSGPYSATIAELGAGLRTLTFEGHDIVVSYDPNKTVPCCNGYVLVPFPNRLEDGEYCFEGTDHALPIDERERQTALHGLGYRYMWELKSLTDTSVTLSWRVPAILRLPLRRCGHRDLFTRLTGSIYDLHRGESGKSCSSVGIRHSSLAFQWPGRLWQ